MGKYAQVYTDGSCLKNPGGPGGWGVVVYDERGEHRFSGGEKSTTNNRMEMMAAIEGLRAVDPERITLIYTDSQYLQKGISIWIKGWKKKNWRTKSGSDVKNKDLWLELDRLQAQRKVSWKWVKGHNGNKGNEIADMLATSAALEQSDTSNAAMDLRCRVKANELFGRFLELTYDEQDEFLVLLGRYHDDVDKAA